MIKKIQFLHRFQFLRWVKNEGLFYTKQLGNLAQAKKIVCRTVLLYNKWNKLLATKIGNPLAKDYSELLFNEYEKPK